MYEMIYTWNVLQIAAEAETEDNEQEQKRQQGKKLLYGQIIQVVLNNVLHWLLVRWLKERWQDIIIKLFLPSAVEQLYVFHFGFYSKARFVYSTNQ